MMRLIFQINYYQLIEKFQGFVKLLRIIHQLIIKIIKIQLSKIVQSGEFLGKLLRPLLKTSFSLMKNVLQTITKSVLIPSELAAASAADARIHKKIY